MPGKRKPHDENLSNVDKSNKTIKQSTLKIQKNRLITSNIPPPQKSKPLKSLLNPYKTDIDNISFESESKSSRNNLWNFKITSWNVNGLRACLMKNGLDFLKKELPDIMLFQEIKAEAHKIPPLDNIDAVKNYYKHWSPAQKAGYSGTGLLSKTKPLSVKHGIGQNEHDSEGRVITAEYSKFYLVNVYTPNSGDKLVRLDYRLKWDQSFTNYVKSLDLVKPVIICGDLNVAHREIDLKNPKTNLRSPGFTIEERESFDRLLSAGFVDTFRHLYPDLEGQYTYWSFRFNARAKNVGWRVDYFLVSQRLVPHVCDSIIRKEVYGSDHCPLTLLLELD